MNIHFISDNEWSDLMSDSDYWKDYDKLDEEEWGKFVDRCEEVDKRLKEIFDNDENAYVISSVTNFSHRAMECTPSVINKNRIEKISQMINDEYPDMRVTIELWTDLSGGKPLGIFGIWEEYYLIGMKRLKPLLPNLLGLKKESLWKFWK